MPVLVLVNAAILFASAVGNSGRRLSRNQLIVLVRVTNFGDFEEHCAHSAMLFKQIGYFANYRDVVSNSDWFVEAVLATTI